MAPPLQDADNFSTLFEFLPIGAYRSSPQGRQLRANPALVCLNGCDSEAELLQSVRDIAVEWYVLPERRGEFMALIESTGRVVGFESEVYRHKSRERIWISENAHTVRDAQGQVLYYEGTVEEITHRVRERQALKYSESRFQQLVELMPGVVYRVAIAPDGRRRYSYMSPGVRALYGFEPEEALRDGEALARRTHPDDVSGLDALSDAAVERRAPLAAETFVRLDDGTEKWVRVLSQPAPDEGGEQVRIGLLFDITAERQAEALRQERDRAAAADRAKSQFMSRVSHELRTPLHAVMGFTQLLALDGTLGERQRGWVRQVLDSAGHLLALMEDVLDLSSADTGQLRVQLQPLALAPVVADALALLQGSADEAGVTLHDETAGAGAWQVQADRRRLTQVLTNLVSNAIKYNQPGGWVRVQAGNGAGQRIEISVADSGPGLDADQQARLFQPFERLGAQRGPVPGTGLGLALSQQLAEAMGGGISVHSVPGRGATFTVSLRQAAPP